MTRSSRAALAVALLSALPAAGAPPARSLRAGLGVIGGLRMQPSQIALAGEYLFPWTPSLRAALGLTLAYKSHIATLEPMAAVHLPIRTRWTDLELHALGGAGLNTGFYRGSTSLSLGLRLGGGLTWSARPGLRFFADGLLEGGPLLAPFADAQISLRLNMGAEFSL